MYRYSRYNQQTSGPRHTPVAVEIDTGAVTAGNRSSVLSPIAVLANIMKITTTTIRNSSEDEIANVNFLYLQPLIRSALLKQPNSVK